VIIYVNSNKYEQKAHELWRSAAWQQSYINILNDDLQYKASKLGQSDLVFGL